GGEQRDPRAAAGRVRPGLVVGGGLVGLPGEQVLQVGDDDVDRLGYADPAPELDAERGDARVVDAAGHERVVPAQVDVAVEGEPVHRHPAADADADRGDLAFRAGVVGPQPHPRPAGHPCGLDAEVAAGPDQCLLDAAHVVDDPHVLGQTHDRVADQLPGAVEGDLA